MFEKNVEFKKTTISKHVVEYIKELIRQGELSAGEKLPPEREMAKMLNLSRNTIREAYKILAALGYVQIKHGQGVFVASEDYYLSQITDTFFIKNDQILELFDIRKILEVQSVKWASERATEEQLEELKQIADRGYEGVINGVDGETLVKRDIEFHIYLAEITGNSILIRIMHNLIDLLTETRTKALEKIPGRATKALKEHQIIVQAMMNKDPLNAERYMLTHLEDASKALMNKLSEEL